jgi:hypothetical protein
LARLGRIRSFRVGKKATQNPITPSFDQRLGSLNF